MSDSDFDRAFGTGLASGASFAERLGRADPAKPNGAASVETAGSGPYKPYGFLPTGTINEMCKVTSWVPGTLIKEGIAFPNRLLLEIAFSGDEQLRIHLPTCIVIIDGSNLLDLAEKLERRQITFMAEYSPKVWPERPPKGEPIIERIEIVRPKETD